MAKLNWKTKSELDEELATPNEIEVLKKELETLKEEKKQSDLAILELSEIMLGGV